MPKIFDVQLKPWNNKKNAAYIWVACEDCGKERWVNKSKWAKGKLRYCHHCYCVNHQSEIFGKGVSGSSNPNWKGGVRIRKDGYREVKLQSDDPFYSMSHDKGYVLEHRLIVAKAVNRILLTTEIVHHLDGNTGNNKLNNLELTDKKNHKLGYTEGYKKGFQAGMEYARNSKTY